MDGDEPPSQAELFKVALQRYVRRFPPQAMVLFNQYFYVV